MRGLVVATALLLLPATAMAPGGRQDDKAAIRGVFETAFDQSRPLARRLPLVEDRDALRASEPIAARYGAVKARVEDVRVYRDRAQVQFHFRSGTRGSLGNAVPFGIAVRKRGHWLVSQFTLCELLDFGGHPCPEGSPSYFVTEPFLPRPAGGPAPRALSLTVPDGTGLAVTPPEGFDLSGFTVRSQAMLDFAQVDGQHSILSAQYRPTMVPTLTRYPGAHGEAIALDYRGYLNFPLGDWVARIPAADLSDVERAFLALHASFNLTGDGMFEYIGDQSLPLRTQEPAPAGGPGRVASLRAAKGTLDIGSGAPQLTLSAVHRYGELVLARTGCDDDGSVRRAAGTPADHPAGQRCFPGTGLELGAEGFDAETVHRLLTETRIRVVTPPVAARGVR